MAERKYDDVLLPFLSLMRKELHANAGKGDRPGWMTMDANTALLEVYYHLAKLQKAVKHNDGPAIMEHSADVANMAMMVLDICGGLAFVQVCKLSGEPLPKPHCDDAARCQHAGFCRRHPHPACGVTRPDGKTFPGPTPLVSGDSEANKEKG